MFASLLEIVWFLFSLDAHLYLRVYLSLSLNLTMIISLSLYRSFDDRLNAYAPYGKEWVKKRIFVHLKKVAGAK
jgi:hypothetical protein